MARDTRAAFLRAIQPRLTAMEAAFVEAFLDMRSAAAQQTIDEIISRYLETGDLNAAVQDLESAISFAMRGFYAPLDQSYVEAFIAGGAYQADLLPKRPSKSAPRVVYRFDAYAERAIGWARDNSARLVTEIAEDTRAVVRETLVEGAEANRSFRQIRRDLVGTTQGNQLRGGLIGLHSRQAAAVRAARAELEAGDYAAYFGRSKSMRHGNFDRSIRAAIKRGEKPHADTIDRAVKAYADNLLKHRGRMIARTEGNKAAAQGRVEAVRQQVEQGKVSADHITKRWVATIGKHTRDHHLTLNGREVKWGEAFISPKTGYPLQHPHDEGAPGADVINCFPAAQPLHLGGLEAAVSSTYRGEIVEISGGNGVNFSVTPNHPVLTERGWVPAGLIVESDKLLYSSVGDIRGASAQPNVDDWYARAEDIHKAVQVCGASRRASRTIVDFHGHVPSHDIDVVALPRHLRRALNAMTREIFGDEALSMPDVAAAGERAFSVLLHGHSYTSSVPNSFVRRFRSATPLLFGHLRRGSPVSLGDIRPLKPKVAKASVNRGSGRADYLGYAKDRFAGFVEALNIRQIFASFFSPAFGRGLSLASGRDLSGNRFKAQVRKAARNPLLADAHAAGHGPDGLSSFVPAFDFREQRLARFSKALFNYRAGLANDTRLTDDVSRNGVSDADLFGGLYCGKTGPVGRDNSGVARFTAVKVSKVDRHEYDGPVYDFQSSTGMLLASGFVVHNCRCVMLTEYDVVAMSRARDGR